MWQVIFIYFLKKNKKIWGCTVCGEISAGFSILIFQKKKKKQKKKVPHMQGVIRSCAYR
jgi:hypothetical protein